MKYSIALPNGWKMSLVEIKDSIEAYETMTNVARAADETGFAAIWLVDHFHTVPVPSQEVTFECWMSLAALARDTKHVRIGPIVSCNSYRNPALLAKMASTLDVLSHGRLNFGIGAGWYEHEYRGLRPLGGKRRGMGERKRGRSLSFVQLGKKKNRRVKENKP